jgi:hypothetical protein
MDHHFILSPDVHKGANSKDVQINSRDFQSPGIVNYPNCKACFALVSHTTQPLVLAFVTSLHCSHSHAPGSCLSPCLYRGIRASCCFIPSQYPYVTNSCKSIIPGGLFTSLPYCQTCQNSSLASRFSGI